MAHSCRRRASPSLFIAAAGRGGGVAPATRRTADLFTVDDGDVIPPATTLDSSNWMELASADSDDPLLLAFSTSSSLEFCWGARIGFCGRHSCSTSSFMTRS